MRGNACILFIFFKAFCLGHPVLELHIHTLLQLPLLLNKEVHNMYLPSSAFLIAHTQQENAERTSRARNATLQWPPLHYCLLLCVRACLFAWLLRTQPQAKRQPNQVVKYFICMAFLRCT